MIQRFDIKHKYANMWNNVQPEKKAELSLYTNNTITQ